MKTWLSFGLLAALAGCTSATSATTANLIGTHDLVFVDQEAGDGTVARLDFDGGVLMEINGVPSRYLFVTSADTNELRVLELYKEGVIGRGFMRAPNPLETLSIPVLNRPTMLATDEGRNSHGARVTGRYVFAARGGGSEVSVVSVTGRRQLGGGPLPVPAPVTALGAALQVGADQRLPATTQLFVSTWDGAEANLYRATLSTNAAELEAQIAAGTVRFTRIAIIDRAPIAALLVVAPLPGRVVDGAPFCAAEACLALATRASPTVVGESFLFEPSTGRHVPLAFKGPIRKFAAGAVTSRIYGLLDEVACGGPQCGGVVAVDLATATASGGFAEPKNAVGEAFGALRESDALITGLTIGQDGVVQQSQESLVDAGSSLTLGQVSYAELGAFASSDGYITYFSGDRGTVIDFDARRSTITSALVRTPGTLPDGGESFVTADGGSIGTLVTATVNSPLDLDLTYRTPTISVTDLGDWKFDISDGYLATQEMVVANRAQLPGLVGLGTTAADGTRLATGGFEVRALVGDSVRFEVGTDALGFTECGRAVVTSIGAGFIEVDQSPAECAQRARFSVRSGGTRPLVIAGGVEGYMGRAAPGDVFTYNRPLVLIPLGVGAPRTALTITIPVAIPPGEGAFLSFSLTAYINPLQVRIDTTALTKCSSQLISQVVFGNLGIMLAPVNLTGKTEATFAWSTFAVVPSGNGVAEISQSLTRSGGTALTGTDGAACYR